MERLLKYFKPLKYRLNLVIDRTKETLYGVSSIYGLIPEPQSSQPEVVKFHAVGMEIENVMYCPASETGYEGPDGVDYHKYDPMPCEFEYNGEILTIPIAPEMHAKIYDPEAKAAYYGEPEEYQPEVIFDIKFRTKLNRNMQGCYLSTYEYDGKEHRIATTQFESHYAREAFPCIDEPAAKASFELTLIVPDYDPSCDEVLANTPVIAQTNGRFEFATTPKMSTYLLAWVIGPLKSVSTVNQHGVKVSSYCALNQPVESLLFANETAAKALDYYNDQFGVKYPLEKLDQVALPDFEAGAMENWGLVTYRESMMLADSTTTLEAKQSIAVTVTHELSHQWFGDLVTMKWWDDLWLNESFATMMEYYCTDALYPEFNVWQDFFTSDCLAALKRDSLRGVQAVKQSVSDPVEIATLFDSAIVYAKGARLMLMLNRLMGNDNFLRGLRDYFEKYQYQNTVGDDLWSALQPYADFNVKEFMHAWISQPGYPALQLGGSGDASKPDSWFQQRFLIDATTDETKWPLPEVKDDMSGHYLLDLGDREFSKKLDAFSDLSNEQKLRLLIDRLFLAKAQVVSSTSLLDLLPKFSAETSASIWSILSGIIGDLKLFCPPETDSEHLYREYLLQIFQTRLASLDFGRLSDLNQIQVRDALLDIAYYAKDETILRRLADLYDAQIEKIDPELRNIILVSKYHYAEDELFDTLLSRYQVETDPEIKSDLLFVLAGFSKTPQHLDRLFDLLREPAIVRPQDHIFLYIYLLRNHRTRLRTLEWLTENWDYVEKLTGDKSIEDYVRYAAALIRTPEEAKIFYDFFDPKSDQPVLRRALELAHVDIDARLSLIKHQSAPVHAKLSELTKKK